MFIYYVYYIKHVVTNWLLYYTLDTYHWPTEHIAYHYSDNTVTLSRKKAQAMIVQYILGKPYLKVTVGKKKKTESDIMLFFFPPTGGDMFSIYHNNQARSL